jgi:hypothetical protein
MAGRTGEGQAAARRFAHHVAEQIGPLGRHLGRPQVAVRLQQAGEQHRHEAHRDPGGG